MTAGPQTSLAVDAGTLDTVFFMEPNGLYRSTFAGLLETMLGNREIEASISTDPSCADMAVTIENIASSAVPDRAVLFTEIREWVPGGDGVPKEVLEAAGLDGNHSFRPVAELCRRARQVIPHIKVVGFTFNVAASEELHKEAVSEGFPHDFVLLDALQRPAELANTILNVLVEDE